MWLADQVLKWCRKEKKRPTTITLTDLQDVYHLPISSAAKKFDIGLTLLKKRCRELGLRRWPYRKLKSMDKLLQSIESVDGQDPQVRTSTVIVAYCRRGSVMYVRSILGLPRNMNPQRSSLQEPLTCKHAVCEAIRYKSYEDGVELVIQLI